MRPIVSLALFLLPVDARPMGIVALDLAESGVIGWGQTRSGAARPSLSRVSLAGLVLLVLAALPGLAYASPPDPSWISGLYDDGDHDDVVVLATTAVGSVGSDLLTGFRPIMPVVGHSAAGPPEVEPSRPASVVKPRAPPLTATSDRRIAAIQPGATVKVLYVEDGGRKQIQSIEPAAN